MAKQLSPSQHACIGAAVGSIEQSLMRPAVFWKSELQQNRFNLYRAVNPRYCYRGLPMAVSSIAPITCIQFGTNSAILQALSRSRAEPLTDSDRLVAGVLAGVTSALVQSPCQLMEVNQQNSGGGMFAMARRIYRTHGLVGFYRGATMTMAREGVFCSSYIALNPLVQKRLREKGVEEGKAAAYAAIATGTFGALLSHPADTIKTKLQGSLFAIEGGAPLKERLTPRSMLNSLAARGSLLPQLYAGCGPRVFRLCCCTYIYGNLTSVFEDLVVSGTTQRWHLETSMLAFSSQGSKATAANVICDMDAM